MKTMLLSGALALALCSSACDKDKKPSEASPPASASTESATPIASATPAPSSVPPPVPPSTSLGLITQWRNDMGMKAPAAVVHDAEADAYLVSSVEGKPLEADGKGFISRWDTSAVGGDTRWIDGGKKGVTLHAPQGMALTDGTLWVADIDTVRMFDRKTGRPTGEVKIPGATALAGMAVMADGRVLVADSGSKRGSGADLEPSGTDAVHVIGKDKKVSTLAKGVELGRPQALAVVKGKVWVASASGELYSLGAAGAKGDVTKLPKGQLTGLAAVGDGFAVSSREALGVYHGRVGSQPWKLVLEGAKGPANLAYDEKRKRLLVPVMEEDEVRAYLLD